MGNGPIDGGHRYLCTVSAALTVPAPVVEMECMAAVMMGSGNQLSLLKRDGNTITPSLDPSCGKLERGKFYRVTFEEIQCLSASSGTP